MPVYQWTNRPILQFLPAQMKDVLDVGCGNGAFANEIRPGRDVTVTGITYSAAEAEVAGQLLDRVVVADLNTYAGDDLGTYDTIMCSHVLEHTHDPVAVLRMLAGHLTPGGTVIVALPNVLIFHQRLKFLLGRFQYEETGLMDRTHHHFFDVKNAHELLPAAGLRLSAEHHFGYLPLARFLGPLQDRANRLATRLRPGLFAWQFVLVGTKP